MSHLLLEPKHRKTPTAPSRDIITNDVATHYNITINAISLRPITTQYMPHQMRMKKHAMYICTICTIPP